MAHRTTKRRTCRHEAGHALIAFVLNFFPVIGAAIWKDCRAWTGKVNLKTTGGKIDQATAMKGLQVVIAGILAGKPDLHATEIEAALPSSDIVQFH
jgi:hypothetical protein